MVEPGERVVDALGREERERLRLSRCRPERAVRDRVAGGGEVRQREVLLQRPHLGFADVDDRFLDHERKRYGAVAASDEDRDAVMVEEERDLLAPIPGEKIGPGERRSVGARFEENTVREARVDVKLGAADREADIGIGRLEGGGRFAPAHLGEAAPNGIDAGCVYLLDPRDRGVGVGERDEVARAAVRAHCLGDAALGAASAVAD